MIMFYLKLTVKSLSTRNTDLQFDSKTVTGIIDFSCLRTLWSYNKYIISTIRFNSDILY